MHINEKLKFRRTELGLTMLQVAKKVGVSEATVSRWESGDIANMRRDKIVSLAKALNVTPSFIMGGLFPEEEKEDTPSILVKYNALNSIGQQKTESYIDDLLDNPRYRAATSRPAPSRKIAAWGAKGTKSEPKPKPRKTT